MEKKKSVLFNPKTFKGERFDKRTNEAFKDAIEFFEHKGISEIRKDAEAKVWCHDWIEYQGEHGIFATMLTAEGYGDDPTARFDLSRICTMSELLGFYSGGYQYPFQVSILGVGPVWMGDNEAQKQDLARQLKEGELFAFGMSEKTHGADLYSNECTIRPEGSGKYMANGNKYYIGNAHISPKVATLGKNTETGEWTFWVVDSNDRHYNYVKDIETKSSGLCQLGEYEMIEYPITDNEILKVGDEAFADGLSTVNIGKFNCGWSEVGMVSHALFEAVTHADRRKIYGHTVTDNFPHIRSFLSESFCRANAMKLYTLRALDYFRVMSEDDRRYLLFNPIVKNKVCREGGEVMRLIMDVVCAKGYETDTYISDAMINADMYARLEGTAHVNMGLILRFIKNYFFSNKEYPEIGIVTEAKDDKNVFAQTMGGLGKVEFSDFGKAYKDVEIPNARIFFDQVLKFRNLMMKGAPDEKMSKNIDYMLNIGEMFSIIVYAQLIMESAKLHDVEDELVDQIFALFIKDMSKYALAQINSQENTDVQKDCLWEIVKVAPTIDKKRDYKFFKEYVQVLDGEYMSKGTVVGID